MKAYYETFFLKAQAHRKSVATRVLVETIDESLRLFRVASFTVVDDGARKREIRPGTIVTIFSKQGKVAGVYDLETAIRAFRDHITGTARNDWDWVETQIPQLVEAMNALENWSSGGSDNADRVREILSGFVIETQRMNSEGKKQARDLARKFETLRDSLDRTNPQAAGVVVQAAIRRLQGHRQKLGKTGVRAERCYSRLMETRARYRQSLVTIAEQAKYVGSNPRAAHSAFDQIERELRTLVLAPYLRPSQVAMRMLNHSRDLYSDGNWKYARKEMADIVLPFYCEQTLVDLTELSHRVPAREDREAMGSYANDLADMNLRVQSRAFFLCEPYRQMGESLKDLLDEAIKAAMDGRHYQVCRRMELIDNRIRFIPRR